MSKYTQEDIVNFLKQGRTSRKGEYTMDELARLLLPEDLCFYHAAAHYQTILDDSNGDFNFIIEKYVFYKNLFIEEEWKAHEDSDSYSKLDFLRDLCEFLEGRIVWMTLENLGYKRSIDDDYLRWKKE